MKKLWKTGIVTALAALLAVPGAVYAQSGKDQILTLAPLYEVRVLAGTGELNYRDGDAAKSAFRGPAALAFAKGELLIADTGNQRIRSFAGGKVATRAGSDLGEDGHGMLIGALNDGAGMAAFFQSPGGLRVQADGTVIVADTDNHAIRSIAPGGKVTTIAGNGLIGLADGKGSKAEFYSPLDVAVASDGVIYVADTLNHAIRKIADGKVSTLNAVSRRPVEYFPGIADMAGDYADGPIASAKFNEPSALALDAKGNLYVSDTGNHRIRYIDFDKGVVTTVAGSSKVVYGANQMYAEGGFADGAAAVAQFRAPRGLAVAPDGGLLIADSLNHAIRYLKDGQVTTIAGTPEESGRLNGVAGHASLNRPTGVALLGDGSFAISDLGNNLVRIVAPYKPPAGLKAAKTIQLLHNQELIQTDAAPVIRQGTTFVPLRVISEKLGYEVKYAQRQATVSKNGVVYTLKQDSALITKLAAGKTETIRLNSPVFASGNRLFLPVRFFAEEAGLDVQWLKELNSVLLRDVIFK
ncbi:stalk domain-containing protein [Paenibacillus sp. GCM10012307]|uniref:Copper amine oxidase n=1 Tax=Paenibacillus roseus TaxID=2798579 RepID=A0A934J3U2_9BACL|nr:stalk domain-containing protein [Paenibacillus roseus]MBJ6359863.1 copper amine oxidase [Paenibacillus roseus]